MSFRCTADWSPAKSRMGSRNRQGLTLMELVVVMAILIALASILVPLFPSMIERAHKASEATNTSELTKAVQLYQAINGNYPDGFDLLTDGTQLVNFLPSAGAASPVLFTGDTMNAGTTNVIGFNYPMGGYVSAGPLTTGGATALATAGIVNLYPLASGGSQTTPPTYTGTMGWTPTFNPYASDTPTPLTTTGTTLPTVAYVNASGVLRANMATPSIVSGSPTQFVLFGVGRYSSMVGTVIASAPNLFPNDAIHENPAQVYERFGVIFQLEDAQKNPLPYAIFLGACSIESDGLESADKDLEGYYKSVKQVGAP